MGETYAVVTVLHSDDGQPVGEVKALVDTGATLTVLPGPLLKAARARKSRRVTLIMGNGRRLVRWTGKATYTVNGLEETTRVIFGEKRDPSVLGLISLESAGLGVDPVHRKLVPVDIHQFPLRWSTGS